LDELGSRAGTDDQGLAELSSERDSAKSEGGDLKSLIAGVGQTDELRLLGGGDAVEGVAPVEVAHQGGGLLKMELWHWIAQFREGSTTDVICCIFCSLNFF